MKNREEPSVISTRPTQMRFDFDTFEAEPARADEPHGQSCLAVTEQPALSEPELPREANAPPEVQQNLMELIVDPDNIDRAAKATGVYPKRWAVIAA